MLKPVYALAACALLCDACGSASPSTPTAPPPAVVNITGTWASTDATTSVTWRLMQTGTAVTGSTTIVDPTDPLYGAGVDGVISGTFDGVTFSYTNSYATLRQPNCAETDAGSLRVSTATTRTGTNSETNSCRSGAARATVTFTRQ